MASTIVLPTQNVVTEPKVVTAFTAAAADIAKLQLGTNVTASYVSAGATLDVTAALHNRKTIKLDLAAGSAVSLPTATGSGARYRFLVTVITTASGAQTITATSGTTFVGTVFGHQVNSSNAVKGFAAAATDDTITLNHDDNGGVIKGEWLEIEDVASTIYSVRGMLSGTGAAFATPFSTAA